MAILIDAFKVQKALGVPVEAELCADVDVMRDAYAEIKKIAPNVVYLSNGTFNGKLVQTFLFGVQR